MTSKEFNIKWNHLLVVGCYGADIDDPNILNYFDKVFENEINCNPNFRWRQIKIKFGLCRVYCNSSNRIDWQDHVNEFLLG